MRPSILIIDDDVDICVLLQKYLTKKGFTVNATYSASKALAALKENNYDVVFCDYRLGDKDGKEVLEEIKTTHPLTEVIIITAYSDIKTAVNLIKSGAFDYLCKPLVPDELINITHKALQHRESKLQNKESVTNTTYKQEKKISPSNGANEFMEGKSRAIKELYRKIDMVAPTDYSIILQGESGSGKEVIAKSIHQKSSRSDGPFVALDCGTLSKELANSELFGHMKGSFTGAISDKKGHFEMANGGTLFLDEVANLSYDIQAALLRVIQERKMKRIGGTKEMKLDVRIIVASHEDLRKACQKKTFREDLFHRLNELSLHIPPLRERKKDIEAFAYFFLELTNRETGKQIEGFDEEVLEKFLTYDWPGNIRELRNAIRKAVLLSPSKTITAETLSPEILSSGAEGFPSLREDSDIRDRPNDNTRITGLRDVSAEAEYQTIIEVLKSVNFNKTKAAKLLNIDRKTLYNKIKGHGS